MIYNLFSVGIYANKLNLNVNKIISKLKNIKSKNKGRNISNPKGTGWQCELNLNNFTELEKAIKPHIQNYIYNTSLKGIGHINSLWANINKYKDYNEIHAHGDAIISSIYYLKTPKNSGKIFFENPCTLMQASWSNHRKTYNEYTSSRMNVDVKENMLLLFPGWLLHGVEPNLNKNEDRISISSNIYISKEE
jgi:uncharacterized protein (TIGR02466 family)